MACGHQRRGASPTPDQKETNGISLFILYKRIGPAARNIFPNDLNNSSEKSPWGSI
jgi:hypothetical protein